MDAPQVYLIPTTLSEGMLDCIPGYVLESVRACSVFYVENERSARRFLKQLWKDMAIDTFEWVALPKEGDPPLGGFREHLRDGRVVGILSEAGCPGVADPGQVLVAAAQEAGVRVKPLVGPNSILLALMASGMNGQAFRFHGYLPIDQAGRGKRLQGLEAESRKERCTQIFIETPYRNNALFAAILRSCRESTRVCIACDLTAPTEWIRTLPVGDWKRQTPELHKRPAIFLMDAV